MKTNITTRGVNFHRATGDFGSEMMEIKQGLPADSALEHASNLLESCGGLIYDSADEGLSPRSTYAMQALLFQTKALVDSVWLRLEETDELSDTREIRIGTEE